MGVRKGHQIVLTDLGFFRKKSEEMVSWKEYLLERLWELVPMLVNIALKTLKSKILVGAHFLKVKLPWLR